MYFCVKKTNMLSLLKLFAEFDTLNSNDGNLNTNIEEHQFDK